jgi:hypothetical protein
VAYKVFQKLSEEGRWIAIIDVKLTRTKTVHRLFKEKSEAEFFIKKMMARENQDWIKIEEVDDEV